MALDVGVSASGTNGSASPTIATAAFTPAAGSHLIGIVRWLPETNAVVTSVADGEGLGNTYVLVGSPTVDANGYQCQRFRSSGAIALSGSMVVTATLTGAATNNAEPGGLIVVAEVTDTGGLDISGGQAQTISSITSNNASTGAIGTPSVDNCLVIAFFTHNVEFDVHSAGTGYTQVAEDLTTSRPWFIEKLQQTTAAAVTATMSVGATGTMNNHAFVYKPSGGGGATGTPYYYQQHQRRG